MHAVILAAGRGSRLGQLDYPKALAPLATGETILGRQIRLLRSNVPDISIYIVVGYRKELIITKFAYVSYVINTNYASENTAKSLLRAFDSIRGDVLWLNGDVVFHPSVLTEILTTGETSMLVNKGPTGEEEVKYKTGPEGNIVAVSKVIGDGEGEALGVNYFKSKDAARLREALMNCAPNDYFEKGIEVCIQGGMKVLPVVVAADKCVEVDFPEDLERAGRMALAWDDAGS